MEAPPWKLQIVVLLVILVTTWPTAAQQGDNTSDTTTTAILTTPTTAAPTAPTNPTVSGQTTSTLSLTWGGDDTQFYEISRKVSGHTDDEYVTEASRVQGLSTTLTGLTPGTTYTIRITAFRDSASGTSSASATVDGTTVTDVVNLPSSPAVTEITTMPTNAVISTTYSTLSDLTTAADSTLPRSTTTQMLSTTSEMSRKDA